MRSTRWIATLLILALALSLASCVRTDPLPPRTTKPVATTAEVLPETECEYYIGNTLTKVYHLPTCSYLPTINGFEFYCDDLPQYSEYRPCQHCNP